jgi:hypothetical protein
MSLNIANGQLAATSTALAASSVPTSSDLFTLVLRNTSGSLTETITITVTKTSSGTARKYPQIVLLPNESAIMRNIPMESGDTIKGQASDATTVDFVLTGVGTSNIEPDFAPTSINTYDSSGNPKSGGVNSAQPASVAVQTTAAGGTAIGNAAAVSQGYTLVTNANNSAAVLLPVGTVGMRVELQNGVATATLQVFPQVNAAINNLAANAVYNRPNAANRTFTYTAANQWWAAPQTIV